MASPIVLWRAILSLATFLAVVFAGSVLIGEHCFPAIAHVPASLLCDLGLYSPPIAAVVAGFIFGWRASVSMSFLAVLVPVLGLAILAAHGALQYWVGHDIAVALQLAVIYCLLPAAVASAASTVASSRVAAYAP